jgi:hypothetical protein
MKGQQSTIRANSASAEYRRAATPVHATRRVGLRAVRAAACAAMVAAGCASAANEDETFEQALRASEFILDMRLRYEGVEQAGFSEDAEALTSRLRAGLKTKPWHKTSFLAEGVWIGDPIDNYNSTTNGQTQYPVVADPANFTAVNRFEVINQSLDHTTLTAGRQRIVLDDQRFVGNVGWRQNEQTFDALRAQLAGANIKADVAYASQVNRVFGPDSPAGRWHGDVVLANVGKSWKAGTLTLFDYYLDIDEAATQSSNTYGARLAGSKPLGKLKANYVLSYATQSDVAKNPAHYTDDYYLVEGSLDVKKFNVGLGYEVLGSDGRVAFATPLATLHAFQGWADKFLTTPTAGIEDSYVKLGYTVGMHGAFKSLSALGWWHDFDAEQSSAHYGSELDLQLVAKTAKMALTLKYADYRADSLFTNTDKFWLSVDYTF